MDPKADWYYSLSPYNYVANNPIILKDPNGKWIESAWDVASLGMGINSLVKNVREGNVTDAIIDGVGIVADGTALALPFIPGGAGATIKAVRATDKVIDATKTGNRIDNAADAAKAGDDLLQGGNRLPNSRIQEAPSQRGSAPIGDDGKPVELHHRDQTADGPIDEMTQTDHRGGDNYKKNHPNTGQDKSKIDRKEFKEQRVSHWNNEWDRGRWLELNNP